MKIEIKKGDRYTKLTIIKELSSIIHPSGRKRRLFECKCDCGNIISVRIDNLRSKNHTLSCGCLGKQHRRKSLTTHGMCNKGSYYTWKSMKQRCLDKNSPSFQKYGAIGINVCSRWINSFENFHKDMGKRPKGMSIDRIDNNKGYFPENCRWVNKKTQVLNRSVTKFIEYDGEKLCQTDWGRKLGSSNIVAQRINTYGWDPIKAITTKIRRKNVKYK